MVEVFASTTRSWRKVETSIYLPLSRVFWFNPTCVICREWMMRGQPGFWDLDGRYQRLSAVRDPLETVNSIIPWPVFEEPLAKALKRSDGSKGGRLPFPAVPCSRFWCFRRSITCPTIRPSSSFIQDRLSFMRFLGLGFSNKVPNSKTIWLFRESLVRAGACGFR